jgi:sec-independent protein translocase protein TatA
MGVIGGWELVAIIFVVLLLFGAKRIPELARGMGKGLREFKEATKEVKDELEESVKDKK